MGKIIKMFVLCPHGHDVRVVGRTTSGRCRACKQETDRKARASRSVKPYANRPDLPTQRARVLTFDIENAPLTYWYTDNPTAMITAIAWTFDDPRNVTCVLLGIENQEQILSAFVEAYNEADLVTGHYIRRHDLPIINGALIESKMPTLGPKLALDTKLDMVKKSDIPATQEHLSDMLGVTAPKVHMTQAMWRESNRLTSEGLELTYNRVVGDVIQHLQLRRAMLEAGLLKSPKVWRP